MKHLARSSVHHTIKLKFVVVDRSESGGLLIFSDTAFEEVLFLLDVHHLGEPWEWVFDTWIERFEAVTDPYVSNCVVVGRRYTPS